MAFQTKDGKRKFGSGFLAKRYDSVHSNDMHEPTGQERVKETEETPSEDKAKSRTTSEGLSKKTQPSVNSNSFTKGMHQEEGSPEAHEDAQESRTDEHGESIAPEEVVAEHGKAHTVTVHHDHTANKHHVMSHHADGHMHESNHESAMEAHEHAQKLGSDAAEAHEDADKEVGSEGNSNEDVESLFGGGMYRAEVD